MRWDYVGRVRGGFKFCIGYNNSWITCKDLYTVATTKAVSLGQCPLTKRSKVASELILAKRTLKGRAGKQRMQIEEFFRDTKNQPIGFGFH